MTRKPLILLNPSCFIVPKNFSVDEVLIAEVIRETKNYYMDKPITPVLAIREGGQYIITGNIAAYLVAIQLSLDTVPMMEEISD